MIKKHRPSKGTSEKAVKPTARKTSLKRTVAKALPSIKKATRKTAPKAFTSPKATVKKTSSKKQQNKLPEPKTSQLLRKQRNSTTSSVSFEEIVTQATMGHDEETGIIESKFNIGIAHNAQAMISQNVPHEYNKDQVTLLVVDPRFVFTYWEIRHDTLLSAQQRVGPGAKLTLRFYDVTQTNNPDLSPSWDVEIFDRLGNWYLRLNNPDQKLCLDIGMKSPTGDFYQLARSNVMRLPPQSLAVPGPIKWMVVTPAGDKLISDTEEYTDADLTLLKKILGPYFFDLLMRGRFASIAGSSLEAIFYDTQALELGQQPGASPSSSFAWAIPNATR